MFEAPRIGLGVLQMAGTGRLLIGASGVETVAARAA